MVELRYNDNRPEIRDIPDSTGNSRYVVGYALKFNSLSNDLGGFYEQIAPGSLDGVIERSDILALYDHNRDRGVLARSTNGVGSLKLFVDEIGLRYEFEAPNSALGDELVESLRRGDIRQSSFAFNIAEDGENWERRSDNTIVRTITKFDFLYDVSPVISPAYNSTEVKLRSFEEFKKSIEEDNMTEDEKMFAKMQELRQQLEEMQAKLEEKRSSENPEDLEEKEIDVRNCNPDKEENREEEPEKKVEDEERNSEENSEEDTENRSDEEETKEEEKDNSSDEDEDKDEDKENRKFNVYINNNMKEKFSLLRSINALAQGAPLDDAGARVHEAGVAEMRNAGINTTSKLVLPVQPNTEKRDTIFATVPTQGQETIAEDKFNLYGPLREKLILSQIGANIMTGLVSDISLPGYTGATAFWKSEGAQVERGEGTFTEKFMSPKRLSAQVWISKQFLRQNSTDAENVIRRDIVDAITNALEKQIFSADAGSTFKPKGIFNGVTPSTNPLTFEDLVELEQTLKHSNVGGNYRYVLSTEAESITRTTRIDPGSGIMLQNNNSINGIPVISSGIVETKGLLLGDFSELFVGSWGGIELTVDPFTGADSDLIKILVTSYWDCVIRRDESIQKMILA